MKPISSICSSFKFRSSLTLATLMLGAALVACAQNSEHTVTGPSSDATGKGNGGNNLQLTSADVSQLFKGFKPRLQIIFEGLRDLALTEKMSPGSTDLHDNPEMLKHLLLMFDGSAPAIQDLATKNNIALQDDSCVDFRGVKNAAAAVLGQKGGVVCFSIEQIKADAPKNFDNAAEIFLLALATHEFTHHFILTGSRDGDEKAAQEIQNLTEQQLARQAEVLNGDIVSTDSSKYVEEFRDYAKALLNSAIPSGVTQ